MRHCVNPACGKEFEPSHPGHIWCRHECHSGVLHDEIGWRAAGMRPLGLFGDRKKIAAFNRRWAKIAREALGAKP